MNIHGLDVKMRLLLFFSCIFLTKGFPLETIKQRNSCGGAYSKTPFYKFLESLSYEERTFHPYSGIFRMGISFITDQRDGILATLRSPDDTFYILLELKNWVPYVETAISSRLLPECLWSLGVVATPGEQITLSLTVDPSEKRLEMISSRVKYFPERNKVTIELDHCAPQTVPQFEHLDLGAEWNAGSGGDRHAFLKSFSGCMAIRINGESMDDVSNRTVSYAIHECDKVQEECPEPFRSNNTHCTCPTNLVLRDGRCVPSCECIDCYNGGICVRDGAGYPSCECAKGYVGPRCEIRTCEGIVCLNGGTCLAHGVGRPSCSCESGYKGSRCEVQTCEAMLCFNGGTCVEDGGAGHASCNCTKGYDGPRCEISIDPCEGIPCPYGYECRGNSKVPQGYECICSGTVGMILCLVDQEENFFRSWCFILMCIVLGFVMLSWMIIAIHKMRWACFKPKNLTT